MHIHALVLQIAAFCMLLPAFPGQAVAHGRCSALALVLAFDSSGSISDAEYILQSEGTGRALTAPEVVEAIVGQGGIDLSVVLWSDSALGVDVLPWSHIDSTAQMADFVARLKSLPRQNGGTTDIGNGLWTALDLLELSGLCAERRLVNLSGDGKESPLAGDPSAVSLDTARRRALSEGVVINGLAIEDEEENLSQYFEERLIIGTNSFVVTVSGYAAFHTSMRQKLLREITPPILSSNTPSPLRRAYAALGASRQALLR